MAIPSVNQFANNPGGGLVTALGGINALRNSYYDANYNKAKSEYAPYSLSAEAASKLAYAQMMGPQFLAKVFRDPDFLAGLTEEQRSALPDMLLKSGLGQLGGNSLNQMPRSPQMGQQMGHQSNNSLLDYMKHGVQSVLGNFGMGTRPNQNAMNMNPDPDPVQNMPPQNISRPIPNQMGVNQDGAPIQQQSADPDFDEALAGWQKSPEAQKEFPAGKNGLPDREKIKDWWFGGLNNEPMKLMLNEGQRKKTLAEKSGEFLGVKEEGKESGKIRAKAREDLDQQYQQALQAEAPLENIIKMTQNPIFQKMRLDIPFFQAKQLDILSKLGSPEQQKLVGEFINSAEQVVASTVQGFGGRILDKEIDIARNMKITPNDTWNTMLGKLASAATFNKMTQARSRIASEIMEKEHIGRGKAMERADKQVNAGVIRKEVESKLGEPKVWIKNKNGERKEVTISEARKMGVPNV